MTMNETKKMFFIFTAIISAVLFSSCAEDKSKAISASRISYDLGVNYFSSNKTRQALENFLKAVNENPDFPEAHNALGLIYFDMKDFPKSEAHFKKAIELKPDYSEAYNNLGRIYLENDKLDKAIEMFKKALSNMVYRTPQYSYANLGWAYYKKGMVKEALEQFNNAVTSDPRWCLSYRSIGIIKMEQKEALEAFMAFDKFRDYCPSEPEAHFRMAEVKNTFGLAPRGEIISDLEKALDLDHSYCPARLMLAKLQDEDENYSEAAATIDIYFNNCHEKAGVDAYKLAGNLYQHLGQISKAAAYLSACATKWPGSPEGRSCKDLLSKKSR